MTATAPAERQMPMTTSDAAESRAARGAEIGRRIEAAPHGRLSQVARTAGVSRQTIHAAIKGGASADTYDRVEAALDALEHPEDVPEQPEAAVQLGGDLIELEVNSEPGGPWRIVVRGPVSSAEELERQAAAIIRQLRGRPN
jgi:hypothetical protein